MAHPQKTAVTVVFPKGFDPQVELTPEGDARITVRTSVREIEAAPFEMTDEFRDFVRRADISPFISDIAMDAAHAAFHEEFMKQSVIAKLRVYVEK